MFELQAQKIFHHTVPETIISTRLFENINIAMTRRVDSSKQYTSRCQIPQFASMQLGINLKNGPNLAHLTHQFWSIVWFHDWL